MRSLCWRDVPQNPLLSRLSNGCLERRYSLLQQFKVPPISKHLLLLLSNSILQRLSFPEGVQFSARPSWSVLLSSGGGNKRLLFCLLGTEGKIKEKCIPRENARPAADIHRCPTTLAVTHGGCAQDTSFPRRPPASRLTTPRAGGEENAICTICVSCGSIPGLASAHCCLHGVHSTPRISVLVTLSRGGFSLLAGESLRNGFVR